MIKVLLILILLFQIPIEDAPVNVIPHHPTIESAYVGQRFNNYGHVGVDFKLPVGTNIYSVLDGTVYQTAEDSRAYGRFVSILHADGNLSLYAHLSKILVKRGEKVSAGDIIAESGGDPKDYIDGDGVSSGAHLHWEIRVKDHLENNLYNIDPVEYLCYFYSTNSLPKWIKIYLNEK